MVDRKVPVTITHRVRDIQPPLFVAGTFSDPQWTPQEMECTAGSDRENIFTQKLEVDPGSKIQYKFRVGHGNWWMLDEDAPTVTDDAGNKNNLIEAPSSQDADSDEQDEAQDVDQHDGNDLGPQLQPVPRVEALKQTDKVDRSATSTPEYARTAAEVADSAAWVDPATPEPEVSNEEAGKIGYRQMTSTPPKEAAGTAAEVADSAKPLDTDESGVPVESTPAYKSLAGVKDDVKNESLDIAGFSNDPDPVPLFAHECAGLYEDDEIPGAGDVEGQSESLNGGLHRKNEEDFGDPTLESFPLTKEEIITTVKKVESGLNADQTSFEGTPPSPVVRSRNPSIADILGESQSSDESPKSPRGPRRLSAPRPNSRGSISERSLSAVSLGSIAEGAEGEEVSHAIEEEDADWDRTEDSKADDIAPVAEHAETAEEAISTAKKAEGEIALTPVKPALRPVVTVPSPSVQASNSLLSPVSDEDEAIALNGKDKDKSTETGYLTPERAATPKPEEIGSPREPAPNAAEPVAEDDIQVAPIQEVEPDEPAVAVPPSPQIVVSKVEDIQPEELPPPEEQLPPPAEELSEDGPKDIGAPVLGSTGISAETEPEAYTESSVAPSAVEDSPEDTEITEAATAPATAPSAVEDSPEDTEITEAATAPSAVEDSPEDTEITEAATAPSAVEDSPEDTEITEAATAPSAVEDSPEDTEITEAATAPSAVEDSPEDTEITEAATAPSAVEDSPEDTETPLADTLETVEGAQTGISLESEPNGIEIPSSSSVETGAETYTEAIAEDSPKNIDAPSPNTAETETNLNIETIAAPSAVENGLKDIGAPLTGSVETGEQSHTEIALENGQKDIETPLSNSVETEAEAHTETAATSLSVDNGAKETLKDIETPLSSSAGTETDPQSGTAGTSSAVEDSQPGSLRKRAAQQPSSTDRAGTPASITETGREAAKKGNWFSAFFRLLFVDWVGGFVSKLCGGKRKT